ECGGRWGRGRGLGRTSRARTPRPGAGIAASITARAWQVGRPGTIGGVDPPAGEAGELRPGGRRPSGRLSACLALGGNRLLGRLDLGLVTEVVIAQGLELVVEFVDQRPCRRDVQVDDLVLPDLVEMLDQG